MATLLTTQVRLEDLGSLTIEFYFSPAERMTHDHPGCEAEIEISKIFDVDGVDITKNLSDDEFQQIETLLWEMSE